MPGEAGGGLRVRRARQVRADLRRDLPSNAQLANLAQHAGRGGLGGRFAGRGVELCLQPAAGVRADGRAVARPGAEAEAIRGNGRFLGQHRRSSRRGGLTGCNA